MPSAQSNPSMVPASLAPTRDLRPWLTWPRPATLSGVNMGHLGFSSVGAVFLLALFVPNALWSWTGKPAGYDASGESRALRIVERTGQVLTTTAALVFVDTNLTHWSPWSWWLVAAGALMVVYEVCWVRYFSSRRTMADFYRSFLGVPVPLAVLPVAAFLLLGIYGHLAPLIAAVGVLGVGHIGIHLQHRRALRS